MRDEHAYEYESWVERALETPDWAEDKRRRAEQLLVECAHIGELAERLGCSVFEIQAELGIGRPRDVKRYRATRLRAQSKSVAARSK